MPLVFSQKSSLLAHMLGCAAILAACSGSDFNGSSSPLKKSGKDKSGEKSSTDHDSNKNKHGSGDGGNGDDGDDSDLVFDEDEITRITEQLTESGERISVDDTGMTFELFKPEDNKQEIDVGFIIDMSSTMKEEIKKVEQNLNNFLKRLADNEKTKNIQVFVLAGKNDLSFSTPSVLATQDNFAAETANHSIDSFNLLAVARDFLSEKIKPSKISLREGAATHLVFITDDQAKRKVSDGKPAAISEAEFASFLTSSKKDESLVVHGIVCKTKVSGCEAESVAYKNLASKYKGVTLELTTSDWSPLFEQLSTSITSAAAFEFKLKSKPSSASKVKVYVDSKMLDESDFSVSGDLVTISKGIDTADKKVLVAYQ